MGHYPVIKAGSVKEDTMENFVERFARIASEYPDKTALVCGENVLSYRQLDVLSSKIAARLIKKGAGRE